MAQLWEVGLLLHPHTQPLLLFPESLAPCHTSILLGRFSFLPPPLLSVRLQFAVYAFQFVEGVSICTGAELDYVPREGVGESRVLCVTHLLCLQVYVGSFKTGQWGEMATLPGTGFSLARHREVFPWLGVQDVTEFNSV
jgi:hypothetical protein